MILIKAIATDEGKKRDILSKIDFSKEPDEVYTATKLAIRDICGDSETEKEVYLAKPWSSRQRSRSDSVRRRSSDRSWERPRRRSESRERAAGKWEERRPRSRERSVAFRERRSTPSASGISKFNDHKVFTIDQRYDSVFFNDKSFKVFNHERQQFMIIDIGFPKIVNGN